MNAQEIINYIKTAEKENTGQTVRQGKAACGLWKCEGVWLHR